MVSLSLPSVPDDGPAGQQAYASALARPRKAALWGQAALHGAPVAAVVLGLFTYWFAICDRYAVFLYGHLGATPFDGVTRSRYWMAGLVASGAVMVSYGALIWLRGRLAALSDRVYEPPTWQRVWICAALPLGVGIPAIVMTVNQPTLPLSSAIACTIAAVSGLALALVPAQWAAQRPRDLVWLALDAQGLVPALLLLRAVELPARGLVSVTVGYAGALGAVPAGAVWLALVSVLRVWRGRPAPPAVALFVAGIAVSYLLLPLAHHLVATPPGYRYISAASNFFAFDIRVQGAAVLAALGLASGASWMRRRTFGREGPGGRSACT